jgi:integration host factor subunit beta
VTKKEIVKVIAERANLTQLKTKDIVQWTFEAIVETLKENGRIELRNFGVFEVRRRKPRKARNPRTGESVFVEAKNVVTFQCGREMEEQVKDAPPVNLPPEERKARAKAKAAMLAGSDESSIILPLNRPIIEPIS